MRDDFLIPNLGQSPKSYDGSYMNRVVRNVEMVFRIIKSVGPAKATIINLSPVTVDTLPIGRQGDVAMTSDGRKNGQGAGAGTGVLVFHDGAAWIACDSGQPVSA